MAYTPTTWVNNSAPALNATNLNHLETGVSNAHTDIATVSAALTASLADIDSADRGWLAQSEAIARMSNQSLLPTAGRLEFARLYLPIAASVANVLFYVVTAGATLTAGQNFAALYSSAGALVGTTADQATNWQSTGLKSMALVGGPYARSAGWHYVAFWYNGTTAPTVARNSISAGAMLNAGKSAPNLNWGSANTGLTTTAPSTMGTQTAQNLSWWVGLS